MLVLLSSGIRERYREDILRALALPPGVRFTFRYEKVLVQPELQELLLKHDFSRLQGIAFHTDAQIPSQSNVVPARYVRIVDSAEIGSHFALTLEVAEFVETSDIAAVTAELRPSLGGPYFALLTNSDLTSTKRSRELSALEATVRALHTKADFAAERCFYHIRGIRRLGEREYAPVVDGLVLLAPGRDHVMEVFHYYPNASTSTLVATATAGAEGVKLTMGERIVIDSPYDLKRVHLKTSSPFESIRTYVAITSPVGNPTAPKEMDVIVPVSVPLALGRLTLTIGFVSAGLFVTSLAQIFGPNVAWRVIGSGLGVVIAATAAVLGLRAKIG